MEKKESLAFLQSCIDIVESVTEEDIKKLQYAYDKKCSVPQVYSEFEFMPPMKECDLVIETIEKMKVVFSGNDLAKNDKKVQINYNFVGMYGNNEQENNNAAFAA